MSCLPLCSSLCLYLCNLIGQLCPPRRLRGTTECRSTNSCVGFKPVYHDVKMKTMIACCGQMEIHLRTMLLSIFGVSSCNVLCFTFIFLFIINHHDFEIQFSSIVRHIDRSFLLSGVHAECCLRDLQFHSIKWIKGCEAKVSKSFKRTLL